MIGKCNWCNDQVRDDVKSCAVRVASREKSFTLCAEHRAPFEEILDTAPGRKRGTRRTGRFVPVVAEDIPKAPKKRVSRKTKKAPPERG